MKRGIPLQTIQQWMQSVIEHPGSNDDAWRSAEAQRLLPFEEAVELVRSSSALSSVDRIGVYRKMFFLRMTESMAIDYPAVRSFLGEDEFDRLIAEEYVRQFPSSSHTLNHLGRNFPEFFRQSRHPHKDLLVDLARLELAVTNNMDAEELPLLTKETVAAVRPEQWSDVTLVPVAALEILSFDHTVHEYLDAVNDGAELPAIRREKSFVVVYRKSYRTFWDSLTEEQYTLLQSLITGVPFGTAIQSLADRFPGAEERLQGELFRWFNEWVSSGFFSSIQLPSP